MTRVEVSTVAKDYKRRPRRYTPRERSERDAADQKLFDRSTADMADPALVAARIRAALTGMSPRILGYSLRNQMLLMAQAEQRGIPLRDVDTYRGWKRRGRHVRRGETQLRIVRPVGLEDETPEADEVGDHKRDEEREAPPKVRFRFTPVYDISQTDPDENLDDQNLDGRSDVACPSCGAAPGQDCRPGCSCLACAAQTGAEVEPAHAAWNNLQEQIVRAGYRFDWPAADADLSGARVRLDHDTQTVHVHMFATAGDPEAIADLAAALGDILTRDHAGGDHAAGGRFGPADAAPAIESA